MARRIFPSFHYQRDAWRASQARNSWVTQGRESAGFWDAADWEQVKRGGDAAIKRWIEDQLGGTSVTVVLIGAETAGREYVMHEIKRSCALNKGLVGVRVHGLKNQDGYTSVAGENPFDKLHFERPGGRRQLLSDVYSTYDYVRDDGYRNLDSWIEAAARAAGR